VKLTDRAAPTLSSLPALAALNPSELPSLYWRAVIVNIDMRGGGSHANLCEDGKYVARLRCHREL